MTQKPRKTRKMTAGDTLITRAELQFFAKAVDARIAQAIQTLRAEFTPQPMTEADVQRLMAEVDAEQAGTVPTDSEGAE